ncbi:uncharacterized protein AMSG_00968 [Thecamonas trahens ATCC 50062]|uniref:Uncharacterized protein n=1 Tax=Thecamonas trahens ATCC 50062 TaxID=461836 RepID=A0A0L0DIM6_THETB|nr:hypothetical protein AMSG_00968 [Thecamonas trahens ATCC 50062]KNC52142.1 hypothetical protein AMSG_00968 [Thecamonas trahens ATCC 50062]|eukprot:XP_013762145.1 hypothetical protein AMSG_00968 [Thecamonas trahens ATCC 50062]
MFPRQPAQPPSPYATPLLPYSPYHVAYTTTQASVSDAAWLRPHEYLRALPGADTALPASSPALPLSPPPRRPRAYSPFYGAYSVRSGLASDAGASPPSPLGIGEWRGSVPSRDAAYHAKTKIIPKVPRARSVPLVAPAARPSPSWTMPPDEKAELAPAAQAQALLAIGEWGSPRTPSEFPPSRPRALDYSAWEAYPALNTPPPPSVPEAPLPSAVRFDSPYVTRTLSRSPGV